MTKKEEKKEIQLPAMRLSTSDELVKEFNLTDESIKLLQRTKCIGLQPGEIRYLYLCAKALDLNPILDELAVVPRMVKDEKGQKVRTPCLQIEIGGIRKISERTNRFHFLKTEFMEGTGGLPISCTAHGEKLWGDQWKPISFTAYYKEFKNNINPLWNSMPHHMLAVKAEAHLRKIAAGNLAGYLPDEIESIGEPITVDASFEKLPEGPESLPWAKEEEEKEESQEPEVKNEEKPESPPEEPEKKEPSEEKPEEPAQKPQTEEPAAKPEPKTEKKNTRKTEKKTKDSTGPTSLGVIKRIKQISSDYGVPTDFVCEQAFNELGIANLEGITENNLIPVWEALDVYEKMLNGG